MSAARVVLWDLDGTLIDSEPAHVRLDARVLGELGVPFSVARLEMCAGLPTRDVYREFLSAAGQDALLDEARALRLALAGEMLVDRVVPCRGAERALTDLPARSVPFGLVTASERPLVDGVLERFGWAWRFGVVVAAEDVRTPKPDPEPYRRACELMRVTPSEALVVEDSLHGIRSARAAGCCVAAVTHTLPAGRLQEAHYVVSNLGAVASLFAALA